MYLLQYLSHLLFLLQHIFVVFLILSHMHLIEYNLDSIEYLESIISNFFEKKKKINKDNCFNLKENFDILLLLLIFIYKYQSLINDQDLSFYDLSNQYTKNRNIQNNM